MDFAVSARKRSDLLCVFIAAFALSVHLCGVFGISAARFGVPIMIFALILLVSKTRDEPYKMKGTLMLTDLNDAAQLKQLCLVLLSKTGDRARVTAAELEAAEGATIRVAPANGKPDEMFVWLEKESE